MNPFKCKNPMTAVGLAQYWQEAYGIRCDVTHRSEWSEVVPDHPAQYAQGRSGPALEMWRNICEAYVAGRQSMAG